jgi:hypothetical protein
MSGKSHAASHHHAIHDCNHGLGISSDECVEAILVPPKSFREVIARLRRFVECTDVTPRTETALACTVQQNHANFRV